MVANDGGGGDPLARGGAAPDSPVLPPNAAKPPPPMVESRSSSAIAAGSTWYRTDQERYRSVYRRANPWYRRLARGVIATSLLAALGVGLYVGAGLIQDYVNRDRLPAPGSATPEFRSTSFLITASAPAPALAGTLTIDVQTRAFEFVGSAGGPQNGVQVVSPDGSRVYVRAAVGGWRVAEGNDPAAGPVQQVVPYLLNVVNPDHVLVNRIRQGYIDLVDQTERGAGIDALDVYAMEFNTTAFAADYPLQWQEFRERVVPGIGENPEIGITMWVDADNVVVHVRDDVTNWAWERLTYGPTEFRPVDPSGAVPTTVAATVPPPPPTAAP